MAKRPQDVQNLCVVPVVRLDLAGTRALAYAVSLGQPVLAVHVSPDEEEDDRFRRQWQTWGDQVQLEIIVAPHTSGLGLRMGGAVRDGSASAERIVMPR
jgi:hypothetical protein